MLPKNLFRKPLNRLEGQENAGAMAEARLAPSVPDEMYVTCPGCRRTLLAETLPGNLHVCPKCGRHLRVGARVRIGLVADQDSFSEMFGDMKSGNPLGFPEYDVKLQKAMAGSGETEAVLTGEARFEGIRACVFAMDPGFMMGSMGTVVGEKIARLFEFAMWERLPVIGFSVSGGARMQEGILSLMQMAKTSGAVKRFSDAGGLYIAVLTDPTTGGVNASFAMEADITLAEPGALIGFAGPRVIEQTIRQKLPPGFQSAEFLLEHGFCDQIVHRKSQRALLARLMRLHGFAADVAGREVGA